MFGCAAPGNEGHTSPSESSGGSSGAPAESDSAGSQSGNETSSGAADDGDTTLGATSTESGGTTGTMFPTSTSTTSGTTSTTLGSSTTTGSEATSSDTTEETDTLDTRGEGPGEPTSRVYILFGQSNMWGQTTAEDQDMATDPRVEVLTLDGDCPDHGSDVWVTAAPSLHGCVGNPGQGSGAGLGPGDYFAKTLAAAHPEDTILLVPHAIPGASINCFAPPGSNLNTSSNCPLGVGTTYENMVSRSRMAQERGEIRGIIFHQGETDCGQEDWPQRVKLVVDQLRADLGVGNVPFLAAEIPGASMCQNHNRLLTGAGGITGVIENAHVVPAEDLPIYDIYHFTTEAQRTLGVRFGEMMLQVE